MMFKQTNNHENLLCRENTSKIETFKRKYANTSEKLKFIKAFVEFKIHRQTSKMKNRLQTGVFFRSSN